MIGRNWREFKNIKNCLIAFYLYKDCISKQNLESLVLLAERQTDFLVMQIKEMKIYFVGSYKVKSARNL